MSTTKITRTELENALKVIGIEISESEREATLPSANALKQLAKQIPLVEDQDDAHA